MDTPLAFSNKKKFLIVAVLLIVFVFTILVVSPKRNAPPQPVIQTEQVAPEPKVLSNVDEIVLQKLLQDILAKGNEGDCETLGDERYQFACHDFFKIQKEQ